MKRLVIYQENSEPIILFDKDDQDKEGYLKELDEVFHSQRIATIHTTEGSLSLRPGKLNSILVQDVLEEEPVIKKPKKSPVVKKKTTAPKKKVENKTEEIDIIKDAD